MSASRERKKRMDQETVSKKKKMKFSEGWILAICVILILAVALCSVLVYRAVQRNQTVLTVGDHKVKIPEFNFFYFNNVSQVSGYATYFGMDTTQPLDQQYVTADGVSMMSMFGFDTSYLPELAEGADTYDMTWAQFFAAMTKDTVVQVYTIYDAAMDAGYTLEEEYRTEMEAEIAEIEAAAEANGESQNGLISRVYGNGCTMEGYRDYMEVTHIASHYPATITYGAEELSARYEESPEDFDAASFYAYSVAPSAFAETLEDGTKAEATDENAEQAKEAAEAMESKFDVDFSGEYGSVTLYADYTRSSVTTLCGEDAANWLFDTARSEDVKLFQNGETYYVLKLMNKEDYRTVNAIEIFIADDAEELAEGEQTAEEKLTDIRTTLEADASEDSYRELLARYPTEGSDGIVTNMTRSTMRGVSYDIFTWAGMEERQAGDWQTFEVNGGTLVLYFTGYGESYRDLSVTNKLVNEWIEEATDAAAAVCNYDEEAAMDAEVGLVLANYSG